MAKRSADGGGGRERRREDSGDEWRCWDGLNPEILALIFTKLPGDELARSLSFVCRGWRDAVAGPYCWSEIDVEEWCRRVDRADAIDIGVRKVVRRSAGMLRRLSAYRIGNWGLSVTAAFGHRLKVLQIPMSEVDDPTLKKSSESLPALAVLDISYCKNITSVGIEALGKHCRSLVTLSRNMSPPVYESAPDNGVAVAINEDEALAVAKTMAGLEHLELTFGRFSDRGLGAILSSCRALRSLNIRGCCNVGLHGDVGDRCDALKSFKDPFSDAYELYPTNSDDSCDEFDVVVD